MDKPITDFSQVTPQWLTERLRLSGRLQDAEVVNATIRPSRSSAVVRIEVQYSDRVRQLPKRFYLKVGGADECVEREAEFLRDMASLMDDPPTVPWYDVAYDPERDRAHILSKNMSRTHHHGNWTIGPTLREQTEQFVDAMARVHAHWWDHPRLGSDFGDFPKEDNVLFFHGASGYERCLARVIETAGDRITVQQRSIYERALASYPFRDLQGRTRLAPGNRLTVIHGDVLPDNVLVPRRIGAHGTLLIDWAFWEVRVGTDDIANLGLYGFCDPAAGLASEILRRYYDGLVKHGVRGYRWEDCWHDFRLSTIRNLFIPVNAFSDNQYYWTLLRRSLLNFDDLSCAELLNAT